MAKLGFALADLVIPSPTGPRILIYHRIGVRLGQQMEVTREHFEQQLDWLALNRVIMSLDAAIDKWDDPESSRFVVLTFDDGYLDTYAKAFPLLLERRIPFTLYLSTEAIEQGHHPGAPTSAPPLKWSHVDEMLNSGLVTLGSHTHTHPDLRYLEPSEIKRELSVSDSLIEARTGVTPHHFAYPWGYWSERASEFVRQRYRTAVLGGGTSSNRKHPDPHMIHRFPVQLSDGLLWMTHRLRGGFIVEEHVRRLLRGYSGP